MQMDRHNKNVINEYLCVYQVRDNTDDNKTYGKTISKCILKE
jgi:hypothetical protein